MDEPGIERALFASAKQPERRDNESADGDNAPCEVGAKRSDFGAEHVGRDMLPVVGGLSNGIRDGVGLFGREFGVGQGARDGVGVEHKAWYHGASRSRPAGPWTPRQHERSEPEPRRDATCPIEDCITMESLPVAPRPGKTMEG